jgi:leucyl/phenylalanyl-tRNA--protein transferase
MRKNPYQIRVNQNFNAVIRHCSQAPRPGQDGTWITDNIIKAYCSLHARGKAHSIEAYDADGKLVGGLYGTDLGGIFAGESMFHLKPNASKIALLHLCRALQTQGFEWIDIQQLTPHMEKLGARQIPRREFIKKLRHEQSKQILFNASAIADLAD